MSYPPGLDAYSTTLNDCLFHKHREWEARERAVLECRRGESNERYDSRMNHRQKELDDKLVDLDMRWQMLEMEKAVGL